MKNIKILSLLSFLVLTLGFLSCDKIENDAKTNTLEVGNNRKIIFHCNSIGTAFEFTQMYREGNEVNVTLISSPTLGKLEPIGNKILRYTPDTTVQIGLDSFKILIKKNGKTTQKTIYLNITEDIPCSELAVSDEFTMEFASFANGSILDILSNDKSCFSNIDTESKAIESSPTRGSINLSVSGSTSNNLIGNAVLYFPTVGFRGKSFFTYKVKNKNSINHYAYANVKVRTIQKVTCDPVAVTDNVTWNRKFNGDNYLSIKVLSNDNTCIEKTFDTNQFFNGTVKVYSDPKYGNVVFQDLKAIYTLTDNNATSDEFKYEIKDNNGSPPSIGTVKITIVKLSDCNTILSQDYLEYSLLNSSSVSYPVLENDLICGKVSKLSIASTPIGGTAIVKSNNSIEFTPNKGFLGNASLVYEVLTDSGQKYQSDLFIDIIK